MADSTQIARLMRSPEDWNRWRATAAHEPVDLTGAHLGGADLSTANLKGADLTNATITRVFASQVDFTGANLSHVDLTLSRFTDARFVEADLTHVIGFAFEINGGSFEGADLSYADLRLAKLIGTACKNALFRSTRFGATIFADLDLSEAQGLAAAVHFAPSLLTTGTLRLSPGAFPEVFLRGCGLTEWEIESLKLYDPALPFDELTSILYRIESLRGSIPIQIHPVFISYAHADRVFVRALGAKFDAQHIRYWLDVHDLQAGRLEKQIDRAIRMNPTVILVLSENSIKSDWVEWEVATARKLEIELRRDVLCPLALDDKWRDADWPGPLRRQIEDYHVLDFSSWRHELDLEDAFRRLIGGLNLFYQQ